MRTSGSRKRTVEAAVVAADVGEVAVLHDALHTRGHCVQPRGHHVLIQLHNYNTETHVLSQETSWALVPLDSITTKSLFLE